MASCYLYFDWNGAGEETVDRVVSAIPKNIDTVIGDKCWLTGQNDKSTRYASVTEFALSLVRKYKLARNDKTLFLSTEECLLKIILILGRMQKETYGSEEMLVSDVLDVLAKIKLTRIDGEDPDADDMPGRAAIEYLQNLKSQNLVDVWSLLQQLKSSEVWKEDVKTVLLTSSGIGDRKSGEIELCKVLFGGSSVQEVAHEIPLDASFSNAEVSGEFSVHETTWPEVQSKVNKHNNQATTASTMSKDEKYTLQLVLGYFRLLVNSRDEMALSRVVSGPGGILDHKAFNVIRKEALKTKTPMYQPMISYVQKSRLGGKFPELEGGVHPFSGFQKELFDFNDVMDKAQSVLEDVKQGDKQVLAQKICQCFKSHIVKSCSSGKVYQRWKMTHLDSTLAQISDAIVSDGCRNVGTEGTSPKRSVGDGGSMAGIQNMRWLRGVIDTLTTSVLNTKVDLHKMLGKVEDSKDTSEFEKSVNKKMGLSPGANYPSVITLFRSPEADETAEEKQGEEEDCPEASLAERLGASPLLRKKQNKNGANSKGGSVKRREAKGKPKFGSTMAWAQDTSPIAQETPPANTTAGNVAETGASPKLAKAIPSLVEGEKEAPSTESSLKLVLEDEEEEDESEKSEQKMRILIDKARCEAELILEAAKKYKRPSKAAGGPAKRSILQEINKTSRVPLATKKESLVDKVEDIMASSKPAATTKKRPRAEPAAGEENSKGGEVKEISKKAKTTAGPKPKKGLVPLKGQMKMTAFMRRL